jgi:hypothetical protein
MFSHLSPMSLTLVINLYLRIATYNELLGKNVLAMKKNFKNFY